MSEQPQDTPQPSTNGDGSAADHRVGPRPLERPPVDASSAAAFGRPAGVVGAFAPSAGRQRAPEFTVAPPPPEALSTAFSRPVDARGVRLQRPPGQGDVERTDDPLWSGTNGSDPWRDPSAGAVIGPPALDPADDAADDAPKRRSGELLSLPEVLFGRRVKPMALIVFALVALLIGGAGGFVGWWIGDQSTSLTDGGVTLSEVAPAKERPAGSVSDIARRVSPAVVSIEIKTAAAAGVGSGVVIDGGGYILTNDHVVSVGGGGGDAQITAVFTNGKRVAAKVVGRDPKTDLAVIKVDVSDLTVVQLGNSDDLQVGDTVIAIGSPLGLADTVTEGIVSAKHRPVTAAAEGGEAAVTYDAIQTDAAINHGNSGGALVDASGALVGINSAIRSSGAEAGSIGLGFAIPVNDARRIAEALIHNGKVQHAELGANVKSVSAETAEGAQVVNVTDTGAAKKAGIQENDVIRKVGERVVRNAPEFTVAVRQHQVGETVPVELTRDGRLLVVQVTLQSD